MLYQTKTLCLVKCQMQLCLFKTCFCKYILLFMFCFVHVTLIFLKCLMMIYFRSVFPVMMSWLKIRALKLPIHGVKYRDIYVKFLNVETVHFSVCYPEIVQR